MSDLSDNLSFNAKLFVDDITKFSAVYYVNISALD